MNYSSFCESISMRFKLLEPIQLILRLLILLEFFCEMTILQQVEIVLFCHIFGQSLLALCGYCTNIKLISRGFQCFPDVQVKNNVTENKFVTFDSI